VAIATITSKGQMTLPKDVRDDLQLQPGDQIDFVKQDGGYVLRVRNVPIGSIAGVLGKSPAGPMTPEAEEEALASALAQEEERIRAGR
jgi:antitoxin PrlF